MSELHRHCRFSPELTLIQPMSRKPSSTCRLVHWSIRCVSFTGSKSNPGMGSASAAGTATAAEAMVRAKTAAEIRAERILAVRVSMVSNPL
ncbi:hypothetical protein [Amycolatopsis sp. NPDC051372]|uniref:hypothetical protein n=1 Tax=Amycolatopsis sp. NPDC051372 TaxID=3155669 RepID=UPI003448A0D7